METDFNVDRVTTGGGLNSTATSISGGRMGMVKTQAGQYMPTLDSEPKQLLCGTEEDYADATWDVRIDSDDQVQIIAIIDKLRPDGDRVYTNPEKLIVYKNLRTYSIGSVTLPKYMSHHTTFGFTLVSAREIAVGDILEPNTVLAHGPSKKSDGNFGFGRETNTAYLGTFGTNEDGAEAAFAIKGMYQSEVFTETEIYVDANFTLLNLFGNDEYFKPIPALGDKLNAVGLLAVKRELRKSFRLLNTSKEALRTVQRPFDQEIYNTGGAEVVDITVIKGKKVRTDNLPKGLVTYLDALSNNATTQHRRILELDTQLRKEAYRNSGGQKKYTREPTWHIAVRDAERLVGDRIPNKPEPSITRNDTVISSYYIKITTRKINTPKLGHKFTGPQAEKYVICNFKPNEDMANDKWGRFAHWHVNPVGVVNRNNPSQLYQCYVTDACFHTRNALIDMKAKGASFEELWEYLTEFYRLVSPDTFALATRVCPVALRPEHLQSVLDTRINLKDEVGQDHIGLNTIEALTGTVYEPPFDVVTIRDGKGDLVTTCNPVRVSNKYIFPLEKIGSHSSACNLPLRQSTGFPAKHNSKLKKYAPMSTQASRAYGESEFRDIIAKAGIGVARLIMNLNSNALATKQMADQLLTKLGFVDMSSAPKFTGRGLSILKHLMNCFGHTLVNVETPKPNELGDKNEDK